MDAIHGPYSMSVIITTYSADRRETISRVVAAWLAQPVAQVWLIDGSGGLARGHIACAATDDRFEYWPLWRDHGTQTDYALALLTDGDYVILADDDFLPLNGITDDLMAGLHNADIVGVIGRAFHGPDYRRDTTFYAARDVTEPVMVDFCGVCLMAGREWFGFDTRGMHRNCDDLWFQMRARPEARKYVVPTRNYENLPCCQHGMFQDRHLARVRQAFYKEHWNADS